MSASSMFDFGTTGSGINFNPGGFNPSASPGTSGSYNATQNPFGTSGGTGSGTGSYSPIWSPNTGGAGYIPSSGSSFFTSTPNNPNNAYNPSGVLQGYQGAYNYNPSTNLTNTFGNLGPYVLSMIQNGGYNPEVFQALIAQQGPQIAESEATIAANTGANGTRFGSGYDLALGDFLSQVNLNQGELGAQLYQQSVSNSLNALDTSEGLVAQNKSNQGGFLSSLLSSILGVASGPIGDIVGGLTSGANTSSIDFGIDGN